MRDVRRVMCETPEQHDRRRTRTWHAAGERNEQRFPPERGARHEGLVEVCADVKELTLRWLRVTRKSTPPPPTPQQQDQHQQQQLTRRQHVERRQIERQ